MARRRNRNAQDIRLAQSRAKVRFGPEHSTIKAAAGQALSDYASDLTSADAAAKSAIHFAKKAKKPVAAVFNQARTEADNARSDVEAAFGRLGGAADPFRAATAREQAGAHERVALAGANALHELTQRQLEAKAGGQYAKTAAKQTYNKTVSDLAGRLTDLGDREGAFITSEAGSLRESRAGRQATTRNARMKIKADSRNARAKIEADKQAADTDYTRDVAKIKLTDSLKNAGSKGLPKGVKPASSEKLDSFESNFAKALRYAKQYAASGDGRSTAASLLTTGAPATKETSAVPSIPSQLALSTALDMAYAGHVGRTTQKRMAKKGIRLHDVPGLVSNKKYEKRRRNQQLASGAS
jgi:hypothetical protein